MIQLLAREKQRDFLRKAAQNGAPSRDTGSGVDGWNWRRWGRRRAGGVAQIVAPPCGEVSDELEVVDSASSAARRFNPFSETATGPGH
jgi:hypothetical protein